MRTLGRHLIIELFGCEHTTLNDLEQVSAAMLEATEAVGATRLSDTFHAFAPQGVSGTVVISESHLSIHTWPEHGYAAVDIFTCGGLDPRPGVEVLQRALRADEVRMMVIMRGVREEVEAHDLRPDEIDVVIPAMEDLSQTQAPARSRS